MSFKFRAKLKKMLTVILSSSMLLSSNVMVFAEDSAGGETPLRSCDLKIVSYNLLTDLMAGTDNALELRAARLKTVLSAYAPDSMGFQEARPEWMNWLKANLTDYAFVGVGRENGTNDKDSGEASPVFYLKDKYNLLDSGTFWLSETPNVPSKGWDAAYKRVCTWAVLQNKTTGESYAHVNTHLDHIGATAQVEGIKLILNKIKELGATYPVVCTGDFNVDMYSEPYSIMVNYSDSTSGLNMADSLFCADEVVNRGGTLTDIKTEPQISNLEVDGMLPIDHCFISANSLNAKYYKIMRDAVDDKHISDHFGVYTELDFGAEAGERPTPQSPYAENSYKAGYGTPIIDGMMDASYSGSEVIDVNERAAGTPVSSGVASAKVRTLYDNNYLYYFAEVTDGTPNINTASSKEEGYGIDGFQTYFDFVNNDPSAATAEDYTYESNDGKNSHESGHFICYPDGVTVPYAEYGADTYAGDETKLVYRAKKTGAGYNIEAKIALSDSLKQRLADDERDIPIGIGYQVNDDVNDDGYRNCDIYCSPRIRNAWKSPAYLDKLVLQSGTPLEQPFIAVKGTAVLDGAMDDVYKSAQAVNVNRNSTDGIVSGQATATVRTVYDDNYLYCFARVSDSTKNSDTTRPVNNYGVDGVQFFIDFAGNANYTANESGYIITDLVAKDDKLADGTHDIVRAQKGFSGFIKGNQYDYVAVPTTTGDTVTGYNIEFKVALSSALKDKMLTQKNIPVRIGYQVNDDSDDDGTRELLCFSKGSIGGAWNDNGPSMLSTMILASEDDTAYSVTVDSNITGGMVTADKTAAKIGELVTLTVTPAEGKQLKANTLKYNNTVISKNSFVMPGRDAVITAEFEDIPVIPVDYTAYMAAKGTAVVDGIMDDAYKGTQPVSVNMDNNNQTVSDRATAEVRTVYDNGYVYCFAEVKDSTVNSEKTRPITDNYGIDGVQFFFDFSRNKDIYTTGESGYIITDLVATDNKRADGKPIERVQQGFYSYTGDMYSYKAVRTEQGYNLELKFALSESLKDKIELNEKDLKIGIGFQVNDDTNDNGYREKLCCSDKKIYGAWQANGPTMLANMYLTGQSEVSYYIGIGHTSGGSISADRQTAKKGEPVQLAITPYDGYQLKGQTLKVNGVPVNGSSFTMPEANVFITAEFEKYDDTTAPVTAATVVQGEPSGMNGWYVNPVKVSLHAEDDLSAVEKTEYSLDEGETWNSYTEPINITEDGIHTMKYYSSDKAGNEEKIKEIVVRIDKTAPVIQLPERLSFSQAEAVMAQFSAKDNLSGLDLLNVLMDGQPEENPIIIDPLILSAGEHPVTATAVDKAGNITEVSTFINITIDIGCLDELIQIGRDRGWIYNNGIAKSLLAKVKSIQRDKGMADNARNGLNALKNEVAALANKKIEKEFADTLISDIDFILIQPASGSN